MWEVGSERWGHWNTELPLRQRVRLHRARRRRREGDKAAFLGRLGSFAAPAALAGKPWPGLFGRHGDAIAALRVPIEIPPGGVRDLGFVLATAETDEGTRALLDRFGNVDALDASLAAAKARWTGLLAAHRVETPDATFDAFLNDWVRYQAISARIQGRCGYYQQSGAFGFRDQLQDSQVWLTVDPSLCREQIALHAAHQFADGSVYHWWHPLSEMGHVTKMTDDLLWLAFVTAAYVRETGDLSILADRAPFLDDPQPAPLVEHVLRAFERVFRRTSPRGLPYIGAGDWNDGLSAVGLEEKGESVWLGALPRRAPRRVGRALRPDRRAGASRRVREAPRGARRGDQRALLGRRLVLARDARRRREDREPRERAGQDLPQRADLGRPERRRPARPRRGRAWRR